VKPNVLIVEDNAILGLDMLEVVRKELLAEPVLVTCVADAITIIPGSFDLALLDINLLDGKSYPVARKLIENDIPFIFVSANESSSLPHDLQDRPFMSKPVERKLLVKMACSLNKLFC
jgi:CheY-like chemotaxis protein